jgi:hypothetical protein
MSLSVTGSLFKIDVCTVRLKSLHLHKERPNRKYRGLSRKSAELGGRKDPLTGTYTGSVLAQ